ncbi:MAG: hypothetical protein HY238_23180 [Acidobacteria bacterium]|nr:hypothetical protein [Acidobacteriota bacterium]
MQNLFIFGGAEVSRRRGYFVFVSLLLGSWSPMAAHRAEPISTEFAVPFPPRAGTSKLIYEHEPKEHDGSEQAIPELELEFGIARRWQINVGFPIFRIKEGRDDPATVVGGKLDLGARYLLFGGATRNYAVSLQGTIEAPTGNRRVIGVAPEVGAGLFLDRYLSERVRLHSNVSWQTSVGQTREAERQLDYKNAIVWFATRRWIPVLEVLGRTNMVTGETGLAVQPEMIFYAGPHFEMKVGLPVGLTLDRGRLGMRAQLAILWGGAH